MARIQALHKAVALELDQEDSRFGPSMGEDIPKDILK
jgi:hypothetical protein